MLHVTVLMASLITTLMECPILVMSTLLSSSQLELCVNSNASAEVLPCKKKFVVSIALDGGQNNTEQVIYWQSATDSSSQKTVTLSSRVTIALAKSQPLIVYPLSYVRNFNGQPYETTAYTTLLQGCRDGQSDASPTCGRAYTDDGAPITFSEGFCCSCDACQLFGICGSSARGNTRCAVLGAAAAAACLRFGPLWYSGYSVGPAQTWYTITITITQKGRLPVALTVGPDKLADLSSTFGVSVRLIGDFAAFQQPHSFEAFTLFVPSLPVDDPMVKAGSAEWLMVPDSLVTLDGSECNKVGVSYEAFVTQGSRCSVPTGTCLNGQLTSLRASDAALVAAGKAPTYLISAFGEVQLVYASQAASSRTPFLAFLQSNVQASQIVLTFVADNMSYSVNTAPGRIIAANVSAFTALSSDGKVSVTVLNTGTLVADFYVSVLGCTSGVVPVAAQTVSLAAAHIVTVTFALRSVVFTGSGLNQCNITLADAGYNIVDSRIIAFNVTGVAVSNGAQGGSATPVGGAANPPAAPTTSDSNSCTDCPFYNPVCFITRSCFWQVLVQIIVVLVIIMIIVLLIKNRAAIAGACRESEADKAERRHNEQLEAMREVARQHDRNRELDAARRVEADAHDRAPTSPFGYRDCRVNYSDGIGPAPAEYRARQRPSPAVTFDFVDSPQRHQSYRQSRMPNDYVPTPYRRHYAADGHRSPTRRDRDMGVAAHRFDRQQPPETESSYDSDGVVGVMVSPTRRGASPRSRRSRHAAQQYSW